MQRSLQEIDISFTKPSYDLLNMENFTRVTYQSLTNEQKSIEKPHPGGRSGGSSCSTLVRTSKSVLQFVYGNSPVASST